MYSCTTFTAISYLVCIAQGTLYLYTILSGLNSLGLVFVHWTRNWFIWWMNAFTNQKDFIIIYAQIKVFSSKLKRKCTYIDKYIGLFKKPTFTYLLSASATSTKYVCVTEDMIPIPWKTRPIHIYITFPLDIPTITQPTSRGKQKTMMVFLRPMAPIEKPMVTEPKSWPILLKLANGVMEESHFLYKIVYV